MTTDNVTHLFRASITAEPGSRLEQLQEARAALKASVDAGQVELKNLTDAIKVELTQLAPGHRKITLQGTASAPALSLTYVESWRLNTKALKADPVGVQYYAKYAEQSGSWVLKDVTREGDSE